MGAGRRRSPPSLPSPEARVARVIPDVAGLGKRFDYLIPPAMDADVRAGTLVRVELNGRRIGGWVAEVGPAGRDHELGERALLALAKVRGWGPEPALIELAEWAGWRWAALPRTFLVAASADHAVVRLPRPALRPPSPPGMVLDDLPVDRPVVERVPPAVDVTPVVAAMAQRGPTLVVVPTVARAAVLADRVRRAGGDVAVVPGQWDQARAGAGVVVGSRAAAWAPCPGLAAVVIVDGHDEGLGQEGAPTWHAAAVGMERARRAGVPCVVTSPCPTLELLDAGSLGTAERSVERRGWATVEVLDRRGDDPRLGLYSERVVDVVRTTGRVVCVLNRTGRMRLLACGACGELTRCERCGSAVAGSEQEGLHCSRCGLSRPWVCAACGSTRLRALRIGVSRAREELEALARRRVVEVTGSAQGVPAGDVLVGTEAVLHRLARRDGFEAVVFLDVDQELLAPRVRAGEEALALLAAASRLVGGRSGRVLVQTRVPHHPALQAAVRADPAVLTDAERPLRRELGLPPYASVALVSGPLAGEYVAQLQGVEVAGPDGDRWLVKAASAGLLSDALASVPRPGGRGVRVAVDPSRF
jgi:primosomal protein N' (replication factor Y)